MARELQEKMTLQTDPNTTSDVPSDSRRVAGKKLTMVVQGDFEVQLVNAQTKVPFPEHGRGTETFVETEPGLEYYAAIRRVQPLPRPTPELGRDNDNHTGVLYCEISVHNERLGYYSCFRGLPSETEFFYKGLFKREEGVESHTALVFLQPEGRRGGSAGLRSRSRPSDLFGQVQFRVFQGVSIGVWHTSD